MAPVKRAPLADRWTGSVALLIFPFVGRSVSSDLAYTLFLSIKPGTELEPARWLYGSVSLGQAAFFGLEPILQRFYSHRRAFPSLSQFLPVGFIATGFALAISLPVFRFRGIYFSIGTLVLAESATHLDDQLESDRGGSGD